MSRESEPGFSIQLNGEPHLVDNDRRLIALIDKLNLSRRRIAIELNHSVVPKAQWADVLLQPDDQLEIVNFVGGG